MKQKEIMNMKLLLQLQVHLLMPWDIINNALDKFEKEFYLDESRNEKIFFANYF